MSQYFCFRHFFYALLFLFSQSWATCYWRSSNKVGTPTDWSPCPNTEKSPGGAELCCINGAQCGEDSICHTQGSDGGSGWFVGGCTDGNYADPVCRTSCTGDAATWIQYNNTEGLWHCCGSNGCTGIPTSESFQAVAPSQWSALPSTSMAQSSSTTSSTYTHTTTTPSSSPSPSSTGNKDLSIGAKAGIGVTATIAGVAIILAIVFLSLWRKARSRHQGILHEMAGQQQQAPPQGGMYHGGFIKPPFSQPMHTSPPSEMASAERRLELQG